jgi:hypothetical protein
LSDIFRSFSDFDKLIWPTPSSSFSWSLLPDGVLANQRGKEIFASRDNGGRPAHPNSERRAVHLREATRRQLSGFSKWFLDWVAVLIRATHKWRTCPVGNVIEEKSLEQLCEDANFPN